MTFLLIDHLFLIHVHFWSEKQFIHTFLMNQCVLCLSLHLSCFEMDANQVVGILSRCYFYQAEMIITSSYVTKSVTVLVLAIRSDIFRRFDWRKVHIIELMTGNEESRYLALFCKERGWERADQSPRG